MNKNDHKPTEGPKHLPMQKAREKSSEHASASSNASQQNHRTEKKQEGRSEQTMGNQKPKDFYSYLTTHREHTIIYLLLIIGLLVILFTNNLIGGLIIGMVAGYYFASEIIYFVRNLGQILGGQDQLRYAVLAALAIGLFIEAPGILIGAIVVAAFKQVMTGVQE